MTRRAAVSAWLTSRGDAAFTLYASLAAFSAYSCMYAFRKPFAAARFEGLTILGFDYKTFLIIAQVLGYMLSKAVGIKVIAEMKRMRRPALMILLIGSAEAALLLFAVVPRPWNAVFLFLNGLPLGMVWGVVFSYIEGRRTTDLAALVLCSSFVLASGFVKTAGKAVLNWGVSESAMPFVTGALFFLPLMGFLWMLESLPPPSAEDVRQRTERVPMDGLDRRRFFLRFAPGLLLLLAAYIVLTAFRDFRDNYMADIWAALGKGRSSSIFTATELPIAAGVLAVLALLLRVKDSFRALIINHLAVLAGFGLIGLSTLLFQRGTLGPAAWMTLIGFGLFLGYIPFNGVLFDRLIAAFGIKSNAGFLIYVADFLGYLASVGVLAYKSFFRRSLPYVDFFVASGYILCVFGVATMTLSLAYFLSLRRGFAATPPESVKAFMER
jgi:hypothetical protein